MLRKAQKALRLGLRGDAPYLEMLVLEPPTVLLHGSHFVVGST